VLWLERNGHAFFDKQGRMVRMIGMVAGITERKLAEEAVSVLSGRLIEAQEQERSRIARDLHDDINQRLALVANSLESIEQDPPDSVAEIRYRVSKQLKLVHEICADVQAISHRLHLSKRIVRAAMSLCQEISVEHKVEIDFVHADIPHVVPDEVSLSLFRVMQEVLHNAVKHSGVRHFKVELRGVPDGIHLIDSLQHADEPQSSIIHHSFRIKADSFIAHNLGEGTFSIDSRPGHGTTIRVRLPLIARGKSSRAEGD
jgi:signal transduction histidine kinase